MRPARVVIAMMVLTVLVACGETGGARTVKIGMRYSRFEPAVVHARAGETIRFELRNDDPIDHEFVLGDEEAQQSHERASGDDHDAVPGEAFLEPGEVQVLTYRFDKAGEVLYGCHRPGHYAFGMRGLVRVAES